MHIPIIALGLTRSTVDIVNSMLGEYTADEVERILGISESPGSQWLSTEQLAQAMAIVWDEEEASTAHRFNIGMESATHMHVRPAVQIDKDQFVEYHVV